MAIKRKSDPVDIGYKSGAGKKLVYYFRKTPSSVHCPHFWVLNWASGCPFNCAYCYLQGTFFGDKKPKYKPVAAVLREIDNFFEYQNKPQILNSGELADSLMFPSIMDKITNKFDEQDKHKILLLTKSKNIDFLLKKPKRQTVVSFSINAFDVAERWEKGTAHPKDRIESARWVKEAGYETRIRIDPVFPVSDWKNQYVELIDYIFDFFMPDRITIGTPRGLSKTLRFSEDKSWFKFFDEESGWGKKINSELRKEIYLTFFDKFQERGMDKHNVSICKETKDLWNELGFNYNNHKCNCI